MTRLLIVSLPNTSSAASSGPLGSLRRVGDPLYAEKKRSASRSRSAPSSTTPPGPTVGWCSPGGTSEVNVADFRSGAGGV